MTKGTLDMVVIGGGIAGLIAANRAAENGLRALVLEKGGEQSYLCNSRFTGGVFHVAFHDPMRAADELREVIAKTTAGYSDSDMEKAIADNIGPVIRWLQQSGIRFIKAGPGEWQNFVLSPPQFPRAGLHWPGRGGDILLRTLEGKLIAAGGHVARGERATGLHKVNGGFEVHISSKQSDKIYRAQAVVIADGGFQGNSEMLKSLVSSDPSALRQRGAGTGCGDGFQFAVKLGAMVKDTGEFYGHVLSRDSLKNDMLWPYPWIDDLAGAGILVDGRGQRFVDEGRGGVVMANAISKLPRPDKAIVIFDDKAWNEAGKNMVIPANPLLEVHGCTLHKASTLSELAPLVELEPDVLTTTVDSYNRAINEGTCDRLSPARTDKRFPPHLIATPPFRAIEVCAGITYTMGGISIDGRSRVLDGSSLPIAGLYAAGATTGGLEGGPAVGYVGGLVKSAVTGFLAGETAAAELEANRP